MTKFSKYLQFWTNCPLTDHLNQKSIGKFKQEPGAWADVPFYAY